MTPFLFHGLYQEQFLQQEIFDYQIASPKKPSLRALEEDDIRGLPQRIGSSVLNLQTSLLFSFSLQIQMILRTQLRGSRAFQMQGAGGGGGRLIVHHAKRIPLLELPRMSFA